MFEPNPSVNVAGVFGRVAVFMARDGEPIAALDERGNLGLKGQTYTDNAAAPQPKLLVLAPDQN